MNWRAIINTTGVVVLIVSLFMLFPLVISFFLKDGDILPILYSFLISAFSGGLLFLTTRVYRKEELRHRDGFIIVTISWFAAALFGALPFLLSGTFASFTDAYFESVAGFTTTGASVLSNIEGAPGGILFWRSLIQWIGGMGIVLFFLAISPMLGGGGMQLFKAEVPEITMDKLRPRLIDTAKSLWYIYISLTALAAILFILGGMSLYDSVCHAFTTLATGGFSTKNTSMAYFNSPYIDMVTTVFMFLAGVNYTLYFYALKGDMSRFARSNEFRFYLKLTFVAVIFTAFVLWHNDNYTFINSLRYASFQVTSIMTTTGYSTANYETWPVFTHVLLVVLMFLGGMIGSTSGGMKQVRILLMFRQAYRELYHLIHPRAVTVLKLDTKHVPKEILGSIWGFLFLYLIIWVAATLGLSILGVDMITASTTAVSALSNVGPALGTAGPAENYASMPFLAKWILIFCMIAGRLEVYTVIILFVPHFWKK